RKLVGTYLELEPEPSRATKVEQTLANRSNCNCLLLRTRGRKEVVARARARVSRSSTTRGEHGHIDSAAISTRPSAHQTGLDAPVLNLFGTSPFGTLGPHPGSYLLPDSSQHPHHPCP